MLPSRDDSLVLFVQVSGCLSVRLLPLPQYNTQHLKVQQHCVLPEMISCCVFKCFP